MKNTIISVIVIFLVVCACLAQPTIEWQKCLGGTSTDKAFSIQQTSDGEHIWGYIIAGSSYSNDGDVSGHHSTGYSDYWVVNLNDAGDIVWQKCLGGSNHDWAYSVEQTADSGFIIAGSSSSNDGDVSGHHGGSSLPDYWVVKLSSAGGHVWWKSFGGSNRDEATSIQQTSDGEHIWGYIIAGSSYSNDGDVSGHHGSIDYPDYWVVKLDVFGNIQWQSCFGGTNSDYANSIQRTTDGGYVVAGKSNSNDGDVIGHHPGGYYDFSGVWYEYSDFWVVKLDSFGEIEWQHPLGGSNNDEATSIQQTIDGGYIVAGKSNSNDGDVSGHHPGGYYDSYSVWHEYSDFWVVKLDSFGEIEWQCSLGGSNNDEATSIQQITDGGYIVAGYSYSNDGDVSEHHGSIDYPDYWVVKLNAGGDIIWQKSLGGTGRDYARSIQQTTDGGFIVAGYSYSNDGDVSGNHGERDYWVVKLSPDTINISPEFSLCPCADDTVIQLGDTLIVEVLAEDDHDSTVFYYLIDAPEYATMDSTTLIYIPHYTGDFHIIITACDSFYACDTCDFWVNVYVPIDTFVYILYPGWNIIGGLIETIPASIITSSPEVYSSVFGFDIESSSYFIADSLYYRKGYWVFAADTVILRW